MNNIESDFENIITGCKQQDIRSQEALYKWLYPSMLKICKRYCYHEEDAGSLFNEGMLKVFKSITSYKENNQFYQWVRTIIINTCIDKVRLKTSFNYHEIGEVEEVFVTNEECYNNISTKEILQLISSMPHNLRIVFNLFAIEGYKHEEIAQLLNIPIGTSKWHLSEARKLLKQQLEQSFQKESSYYER